MLRIEVNGDINKALKKLKRKVRNTKQVTELRDRKKYTKPTASKREAKKKAIYKNSKDVEN